MKFSIHGLSIDGSVEDADEVLMDALRALGDGAMTEARRAVALSSDLLDMAVASARCAEAYRLIVDAENSRRNAERYLSAAAGIATLMCAVHESLDDVADMAYSDYVMGIVDTSAVSALLEGAARRFNEAIELLPDNPSPAARFRGIEDERHSGSTAEPA